MRSVIAPMIMCIGTMYCGTDSAVAAFTYVQVGDHVKLSQGPGANGGVALMDLVHPTNGTKVQSQMVWNPNGVDLFREVPEPTSLALFGMGMVGAAWNRRRQNRLAQVA